jgi:osmoprotectant transport system substrate-binding protein
MRKQWRTAAAVFAAVAVVVALVGCSSTASKPAEPAASTTPVTVGSKIDTEGKLLGEMIVIALKNAGLQVNDKTEFGTTDVVRKALLNGEVDIYPEYTGSGLIFFEGSPESTVAVYKNPEKGYETVKTLDLQKNKIVWLTPAKANNTWAIAVKKDFAEKNNLKTISDMAAYVKSGKAAKMAASDEFFNNADAWPAFKSTYGFDLKKDQRVILAGGNTAQTEKAVADGTNGVNFGMAYGTDGALSELGLVVLTDDKNAQLVYWPVPTIRADTLAKNPQIEKILAPIFAGLTLEKLQELNGRVQVGGEPADKVATDYLKSIGAIK